MKTDCLSYYEGDKLIIENFQIFGKSNERQDYLEEVCVMCVDSRGALLRIDNFVVEKLHQCQNSLNDINSEKKDREFSFQDSGEYQLFGIASDYFESEINVCPILECFLLNNDCFDQLQDNNFILDNTKQKILVETNIV